MSPFGRRCISAGVYMCGESVLPGAAGLNALGA